jgi:hypothetical protein
MDRFQVAVTCRIQVNNMSRVSTADGARGTSFTVTVEDILIDLLRARNSHATLSAGI